MWGQMPLAPELLYRIRDMTDTALSMTYVSSASIGRLVDDFIDHHPVLVVNLPIPIRCGFELHERDRLA
jgi:hypothetical protein